jgi:hypothetical protein
MSFTTLKAGAAISAREHGAVDLRVASHRSRRHRLPQSVRRFRDLARAGPLSALRQERRGRSSLDHTCFIFHRSLALRGLYREHKQTGEILACDCVDENLQPANRLNLLIN